MIVTREEAIIIIDNLHLIGSGRNQHENDLKINAALDMANEALKNEPQGKWEYCEHEIANHVDGYKCSNCGFFVPWDYEHKFINFIKDYNFCPSCRADMRGENK